jgi:hypothetical protein
MTTRQRVLVNIWCVLLFLFGFWLDGQEAHAESTEQPCYCDAPASWLTHYNCEGTIDNMPNCVSWQERVDG